MQTLLCEQRLELCQFKLNETLSKKTNLAREYVKQLQLKLLPPTEYIAIKHRDVKHVKLRLDDRMTKIFEFKTAQVTSLSNKLDLLNPMAILNRGYGIILNKKNIADRSIGSVSEVTNGEAIEIRLIDGRIDATVQGVQQDQS